jgi:hypothetical protein
MNDHNASTKPVLRWRTLDARIALARYRVLGDAKLLVRARNLAFDAGWESRAHSIANATIVIPPLIADEPTLYRRWLVGRIYATAEFMESETWSLPCLCDDSVGYQCPHHLEVTQLSWFMKCATRKVKAQLQLPPI